MTMKACGIFAFISGFISRLVIVFLLFYALYYYLRCTFCVL